MSQSSKATKVAAAVLSTVTVANLVLPFVSVLAEEKTEAVTPSVTETVEEVGFKRVKVIYRDGNERGGEARVMISEDATTIPATNLKVPEGYHIVSVGNINKRGSLFVSVAKNEEAKPEVTTKLITVRYQTSTGVDKGQEKITVEKDATTIPETDLKNVPEGYKVVGAVEIDGRFATAIVEPIETTKPEESKVRFVRVEYVNAAGAIVSSSRVKVKDNQSTITVATPEGYDLFDTNNVLSIDDNTDRVEVFVMKAEPKPEGYIF